MRAKTIEYGRQRKVFLYFGSGFYYSVISSMFSMIFYSVRDWDRYVMKVSEWDWINSGSDFGNVWIYFAIAALDCTINFLLK